MEVIYGWPVPVVVVEDDEHAEFALLVLRDLEEVLHVPEELRSVLVDECVALKHGLRNSYVFWMISAVVILN